MTQALEARLTYGSVCSGIEAASVAWHPLGWKCAFASEIEPFPRAVLKHRFPETPLHGDFTTIQAGEYEPIDLLVGGTPCQSFSIAGLRGGLDDDRGNLALEYLRLAQRLRPRWLVWENVPGVLSSAGGRDFGAILGGMVELGYGVAYRVLDAQFFGVAQRRRRVFVVGYVGDWRRAAAVLFERHSLSGHPAPRREAGKGFAAATAPSLTASGRGVERTGETRGQDPVIAVPGYVPDIVPQAMSSKWSKGTSGPSGDEVANLVAPPLTCNPYGDHESREGLLVAHALRGEGFDASEDGTGRGTPIIPVCFSSKDHGADAEMDLSPTLRAGGHSASHANAGVPPAVAYSIQAGALRENPDSGPDGVGVQEGISYTLEARPEVQAVAFNLRGREGGAMPELDELVSMRAASGGSSRSYLAFDTTQITSAANRSSPKQGDPCHPLSRTAHPPAIAGSAVRRLTPRECERLQGFPDDYTLIPWRKGVASDGPRYKALGNSMAVPVMAWIGQRIQQVEESIALPSNKEAA